LRHRITAHAKILGSWMQGADGHVLNDAIAQYGETACQLRGAARLMHGSRAVVLRTQRGSPD